MKPAFERVAMAVVPLLAVATLALGLRIGGRSTVRGAVVDGAAPSARGLAWSVTASMDDRGVREPLAHVDVEIVGTARGKTLSTNATTDDDGVAEFSLPFEGVKVGDAVDLEVRDRRTGESLTKGPVVWNREIAKGAENRPSITPPTTRSGAIRLEVAPYGERVPPGFSTPVFVHAARESDGEPLANVHVEAVGEGGVSFPVPHDTTCASGWAEVDVLVMTHVAGATFRAKLGDAEGSWFGPLPTAPASADVRLPAEIRAESHAIARVMAPPAKKKVLVEIVDGDGREFAASTPLVLGPSGYSEAVVDLPPLHAGGHWLVTGYDTRSIQAFEPSVRMIPFQVVTTSRSGAFDRERACEKLANLAGAASRPVGRFAAIDGFPAKRRRNELARRRGVTLAVGATALGAFVELALLLRASRRSKRALAGLPPEADGARAWTFVVTVGIVVLGFALLSAAVLEPR
ncbi:MAG: hypothetical protein U0169_00045 [Polyangiaceae bacterium]